MKKFGAFVPCACWRSTKRVVEPRKRQVVQSIPQLPEGGYSQEAAAQKVPPSQKGPEARVNVCSVLAFQKPQAEGEQVADAEQDCAGSKLTGTGTKDALDNRDGLTPASYTGPQLKLEVSGRQTPSAVGLQSTQTEDLEKLPQAEGECTDPQDTALAEELKTSERDGRNASQKTAPAHANESRAVPHLPVYASEEDKREEAQTYAVAQHGGTFTENEEDVISAKFTPGHTEPIKSPSPTHTLAVKAEPKTGYDFNRALDPDAESDTDRSGKCRQSIAVPHNPRQDSQSERKGADTTAVREHVGAASSHQEDGAGGGESVEQSSFSANNAKDNGGTHRRPKHKKKKSGKAKGKRCHGRTGRR